MSKPGATPLAAKLYRLVLCVGVVALLAVNLPGHLSYDSVAQLHEGRLGVRETWGPVMYAWLLGRADSVVPGASLYVVASALVLLGAFLGLRTLRPRTSWLAVAAAAAVMATPQLLIYQAIVWKDVLFANLALAAFVCLAHAARRWGDWGFRLGALAAAMLCVALGALVRQNGAIVLPFAAVAIAWTARRDGWLKSLSWGGGWLVATALVMQLLAAAVALPGQDADPAINRGVRIVAHYDIIGAVAHRPGLPLARLHAADPKVEAAVRRAARMSYSAERVDSLDRTPELSAIWLVPDAEIMGQWRDIVHHQPGAYAAHRLDVFRWLVAAPVIDRCLPVHVGVGGAPDQVADLGVAAVIEPQDRQLSGYAARLYPTPVYSHVSYILICLAVLAAMLLRRQPADWMMAALMASALAFAASFLVISIACDYRYLYFLDLAAMAGALYVALDPPGWPRRRQAAQSPGQGL